MRDRVKLKQEASQLPSTNLPIALPIPPPLASTKFYKFKSRKLPDDLLKKFEVVSPSTQIFYDQLTASIFVSGTEQNNSAIIDYCESIDVTLQSCSMRAWVVFSADGKSTGWDFSTALAAILENEPSILVTPESLIFSTPLDNVVAALTLIASMNDISFIQRPSLIITDSITSTIESTEELPIPTTTLSNGISQTSIAYKKVGLELSILPVFQADDTIKLNVKQKGGIVGREVTIADDTVPVLQTQSMTTEVIMRIGQTIVLGGVEYQRKKSTKSFLSDNLVVENGSLHIVISLSNEIPRAIPVTPDDLNRMGILPQILKK